MPDNFLYSVERVFDSPVAAVWAAWTDPVSLEAWYHPTDLLNVPGSVTSDAEVGGAWSVAVAVPEHDVVAYFFGRYTDVVENVRLEHTMLYTVSADEFAARDESGPSHIVIVDFEGRDGSTWVRFAQYGELPGGEPERAKAGMESYFDSLQAFLA